MEHFIESVRKYPCLWNTTAIEYRDQELKDAAWAEVMKETDLSSVKEVKLRWKKLRDSYRDALKRQSDMLAKEPGGAGAKKTYHWKYMGQMQFLQPYMSARKRADVAADEPPPANGSARAAPPPARAAPPSRSSDTSDSDSAPEPPAKRRALSLIERKLDYLCRRLPPAPAAGGAATGAGPAPPAAAPQQPDPLDIFFNSMCQNTKRFPYQTQIKIKRAVFEAVTAAEEALLAEQHSYAALWARAASSSSSERSPPPPAATPPDHKP